VGTWGTGIFDDDVAADVRGAWDDAVASGANATEATQRVLDEFNELIEDG
jgi:hypothetical protein